MHELRQNFTTDELRATHCRYCGTLLAHHARAQQQVAVIHQMMADRNGNGIPDAFEGVVANAQANAMHQAFGMPPAYGAPPMVGAPPMYGAPPAGGFGYPPAAVHMNVVHAEVAKGIGTAVKITLLFAVIGVMVSVGIAVAVFMFAAPPP